MKNLIFLLTFSAQAAVPYGDLLEGVAPGPDGFIHVVTMISHPDDESVFAGGTLIKLKKDPRVRLHLVCLTLGDASDARFFMLVGKEEMARIRTEELQAAGRELGADEVIQLSYHDQGLKPADQEKLIAELPQKRRAIMAHESQMRHSLVGLDLPQVYYNRTEYFALADPGGLSNLPK